MEKVPSTSECSYIPQKKHLSRKLSQKAFRFSLVVPFLCLIVMSEPSYSCTSMVITKGASADGSMYITHSNDGYTGDTSVVYVPARDHEPGEMRPVYPSACASEALPDYNCYYTPRLNVKGRGPDYRFEGLPITEPLGEIPEVAHTYAYLDSNYGIINEYGLMLGECTDNSAHIRYLKPDIGTGIFYSSELGRVALERCKTAREAVRLIGELIDEYGLWGTAETLIIGDKEEAFVLEMMPNPSGRNSFWAAQKIPDGHFFIAANQFRIRSLDPHNPDQIFNPHLTEFFKELGWAVYDENGYLDWLKSVDTTENFHPYYSLRRVWRAMSLVAPSAHYPAWPERYDTKIYPFSVKPDKPLTLNDIKELHRDTYQNTEFAFNQKDTGGLFALPYGYGNYDKERVISTPAISYIWINQFNDKMPAPISWLALTSPAESVYVPLPVAPITKLYSRVNRKNYDESKFYWVISMVSALTKGYYSLLSPEVKRTALDLEDKSQALIAASMDLDAKAFNEMLLKNAEENFSAWNDLYAKLIEKMNYEAITYDKDHRPLNHAPKSYAQR